MKAKYLLLVSVASAVPALAELSAPDNIVYGTIHLNSMPVIAANTSIVVEARRTLNGPAIASYQIGSNADAADFYELRIPIEEQAPLDKPATSSLVTDSAFIVVRDLTADQGSQMFTIPERGHVQRVDFDINPIGPITDNDDDGLPDGWEMTTFGSLDEGGSGDLDGDGASNFKEFTAGTDPRGSSGYFQLIITRTGTQKFVSFFGVSTAGVPGYENSTRHYAIESAPSLVTGPWTPVTGYSDIIGTNATVSYPTQEPAPAYFYRGRVWLTRP